MANLDPTTPQVVDPELTVDLTRLLQIRGPLGILNVLDTIVPVVNMGDVVSSTVNVQQPRYRTSDIFSNGWTTNAVAGTVLADTGALAEGIYDVILQASSYTNVTEQRVEVQFRNAANTANLASWDHGLSMIAQGNTPTLGYTVALDFAANERLRIIQVVAGVVTQGLAAIIFARLRA